MLEQPAQRQFGRPEPLVETLGIEARSLPAECPTQPVEHAEQVLEFGARQRRLPRKARVAGNRIGGLCHRFSH